MALTRAHHGERGFHGTDAGASREDGGFRGTEVDASQGFVIDASESGCGNETAMEHVAKPHSARCAMPLPLAHES